MTRTPAWVRAVGAVIAVVALVTAAPPPRRPSGPITVLDPFVTPAYAVTEINDSGRATFCHIEGDRWRPGQPDSARLAPATSQPVQQPTGPRTSVVDSVTRPLDPAQWRLTAAVLSDRIALCAAKGFVGAIISIGERAPADLIRTLRAQANRWGLLVVLVQRPHLRLISGEPSGGVAAGSADTRRTTGS